MRVVEMRDVYEVYDVQIEVERVEGKGETAYGDVTLRNCSHPLSSFRCRKQSINGAR